MAGRPPLYETPEQLEAAIEDYFNPITQRFDELAKQFEKREPREKVTISGLAYHLGFSDRQSLYDYEEKEGFTCIIKRARLRVEMAYEEKLSGNAVAGSIFALKNMGWKDKTEQEIHGAMPVVWNEQRNYPKPPNELNQISHK